MPEVDALLAKGRTFIQASFKTQRQWQCTAARRIKELKAAPPVANPAAPPADVTVVNGRADRRRQRRSNQN